MTDILAAVLLAAAFVPPALEVRTPWSAVALFAGFLVFVGGRAAARRDPPGRSARDSSADRA